MAVRWTYADVDQGVEELLFVLLCQNGRMGLGKGSMVSKDSVGLPGKGVIMH